MRTRQEIEKNIKRIASDSDYINVLHILDNQKLQIEVLLDIRDLLTNQ